MSSSPLDVNLIRFAFLSKRWCWCCCSYIGGAVDMLWVPNPHTPFKRAHNFAPPHTWNSCKVYMFIKRRLIKPLFAFFAFWGWSVNTHTQKRAIGSSMSLARIRSKTKQPHQIQSQYEESEGEMKIERECESAYCCLLHCCCTIYLTISLSFFMWCFTLICRVFVCVI